MAVEIPYDLTEDLGVNSAHAQADIDALAEKFNQGITEDDFDPTIILPSAKLSAPSCEEVITLDNAVILPAASTTVPLAFARIGGTGSYTILDASYAYTVTTSGTTSNGSISLRLGTITAGVWATSGTIVATTALSGTTTSGQSAQGALTLSATSFSAPLCIALMPEAAATDTAVIRLKITIKIKRALQ